MARTIEDLELGLSALAGPNRWDHPAWRLELPPPRHRVLKEYRVAAWLDDPSCRLEPEVRASLERAAQALASAGATVAYTTRLPFTLEKVAGTFLALLQGALSGGVTFDQIEKYAAATGDTPAAQIKRLQAMRHRHWLSHNERRLQMRKQCEEFFENWDAILMPVMPCPAIPHDHSEPLSNRTATVAGEQRPYWNLNAWMALASVCYLPATVVPVGCVVNKLPVGIQIVGPYLEDRTTLELGRHLLTMMGGCPRPSGF
jgi:amidase